MKTDETNPEAAARSETPDARPEAPSGLSRRSFLGASAALAGAAALLDPHQALADEAAAIQDFGSLGRMSNDRLAGASIVEQQALMQSGRLSSLQLVQLYKRRIAVIDRGLGLNAVLELNPEAERIARQLDRERASQGARGPLHGIPVLLKDNIDTGDRMMTTAGSLGLVGQPALQDSTVVAKLRQAGAVILGKVNLSEWANFRGFDSSSGWSGVGGQTGNPFILDRNPCGSSAGSGAAVAAALATVALATETDGSIVCPASHCGVVGIKPTVGLTSRAGVVPISSTQDSVGPHGRTVADAAAVLGALTGLDPRDPKTQRSAGKFLTDYLQFVNPDGLRGARIGVPRQITGPVTTETDAIFENALSIMSAAGAEIVDNVVIPSFEAFQADQSEIIVLIYEFKRDLNAYLATRRGVPITDMASAIQFNLDNADVELAYFGQEYMELAQQEIFSLADYQQALATGPRLAGEQGIDAVLAANQLDALVAPTNSPPWPTDLATGDCFKYGSSSLAAVAGYPLITVPMGYAFDLPLGLTFMASAFSEPTLIKLAAGFEAAANLLRRPRFLRTFPDVTRARLRDRVVIGSAPVRAPSLAAAQGWDKQPLAWGHRHPSTPFVAQGVRRPQFI